MARKITYQQAINEALDQEMSRDQNVIVIGEDVAGGEGSPGEQDAWGGVLGVTRGLYHKHPGRVIDTPISESGYVGAAVGPACCGMRPVAELIFVDFLGVCFDQIFNQAAKFRYMFGGKAETPVAFGHSQLGGVGQMVAQLIKDRLGYKYHWALADYLQRSAPHLASRTDVEQAHALGVAAVDLALQGKNAVMATIERVADAPYRWQIGNAPLKDVANVERKMPAEFITGDGFHITDACRAYLQPLIEGEDPPPYRNGLPDYVRLRNATVGKKLGAFKI